MDRLSGLEIDPHEMLKMRDLLDVAGVRYVKNDGKKQDAEWMRWQTKSPDFHVDEVDGRSVAHGFSVVLAPYSYGGADGLLELWAEGMEGPCGYLKADGVMEKLRKAGLA
jgi:hypothetical protein